MAFGGKGWKAGGKTRKIRPSGGDLCTFRHVAGRSVQDCGKVVQKLAGREDENHKLCTTLCAPLRLGTRIVQVSFPLGVRCVGVVVRRCAIRSFSLPPAEAGCPFRRRGRGRRQVAAGRTHGASPISGRGRGGRQAAAGRAHGASPISERGRGRRQAAAGRTHGASPISERGRGRRQAAAGRTHGASPISGRGRGRRQAAAGRAHGQGRGWPCALLPLHTVIRHTSGMVRHCAKGRPPLPSPSPTLRTAARDTVAQRRGLFSGAARTLPGSGRRANDILYILVRRREGENVLHRAAGNDVDNFSVDNPLWITAAAGCRLICGGRGKRCRGSVNADGAGAKAFAGDGCSQGASFDPMAAISRRRQGGRIYNNTRARVLLRRMCVKPADLTTHSPPKTCSRPRTATRPPRALPLPHAAPMHARRLRDAILAVLTTRSPPKDFARPAQRRCTPFPSTSAPHAARRTPAGCAMHSPPTSRPIPRRRPSLAPAQRHALPEHFRLPRSPDARPQAARCIPRRPHNSLPAEDLRPPRTATRPSRALPLPHAAPTHARRLRDAFPAESLLPPPQRLAASPSVPLRAQKNGTAQWMCDAECLGRPSLRSVIGVGEPRAVRRRCGALACRRGA